MRLRSRLPAVVLPAAVLLLALSACASDVPNAVQPETPSSLPSPVASPTSSSTPVQDATDPSTWLITTASIGPIELGMLRGAADEALAAVFALDFHCGTVSFFDRVQGHEPFDLAIQGNSTPDDLASPIWSVSISTNAPLTAVVAESPRTDAGIALGSTVDELTSAYPEAQLVPLEGDRAPVAQYQVPDDAGLLRLTLDEQGARVRSIAVEAEDLEPSSCM